ncbi:hypothetical protein C0992_001539, partial [Termitomyces sp. T32_za158]
ASELGSETLQALREIQGATDLLTDSLTPDDTPTFTDTYGNELDWEDVMPDAHDVSLAHAAHDMIDSRTEESRTPTALVLQGYLGTTPENPTLTLSLRTLELYYRIQRQKASFSIEAFAKVICDLYMIPYCQQYRDGLSNTFEAYVQILQIVDRQVAKELGRDGENWRVLNTCPPCCYEIHMATLQLENEPPLKFSRMFVMDGNNSLKRIANIGDWHIGDNRTFDESDFYLSSEFVDKYADEVKKPAPEPIMSSFKLAEAEQSVNEDDNASEVFPDGEPDSGDPMDGAPPTPCTNNWKAAAADSKKKTWAIFDEAGIFASACRHRIILWLADMVQSGELNMGAVQHHPNIIEEMGLKDLETLERVFSSSNQLGTVTRYMSKYWQHVFIDLFFRQWDDEKYHNLSTMLYNNYKQALEIIHVEGTEHACVLEELQIDVVDLEKWRVKQKSYFSNVGKEPEQQVIQIAYVKCLHQLREVE